MTSNKYRVTKNVVVAAALAGGVSCVASAGDYYSDNGDSRLGGDSYAYFSSQPVDKSPSEWRQTHPHGISELRLQSYSGVGEAWKMTPPVFTNVASDPTFRQTRPNGLTEGELQALSSEGPAWHSGPAIANTPPSIALQPSTERSVHFSDPSN